MIGVFRIDGAQYVELHPVALQQAAGLHDLTESPAAALVLPVEVMKFLGTIDAQADQKTVLVEKPAPFVVKQDAVGLEGVLDPGAGPGVLSLEFNGVPKEIETHEGRFAPLPCDGDLRNLVDLEKLPDISLVDFLGHPEIAARVKIFFLEEEAVITAQIADRSGRLGHDVESPGYTRRMCHG